MSDLEQLKAAIDSKMATNPEIRYILKLISSGKASLDDSAKYAQILSHILGQELASEVLELSDREDTTSQLLHGAYDDVNDVYSQVQTVLDKKAGIAINPKRAPFPAERVKKFAHSLVDPTVEDSVIKRRARAGSETITKSFHDDCIETNAKFRDNAGLKSYIIRKGSDCCEWCTKVAGKYRIGDQPEDIFRRHDNCDCTIIYDGQVLRGQTGAEGKRGKKWVEVPEGAGAEDAVRYSQDQAKLLNEAKTKNINESGISGKHIEKTSENTINIQYIESKQYKDKFNTITDNDNVNEVLYKQSKAALIHRNGTDKEDMWLINSETGNIEGKQTNAKSNWGVDYNNSLKNAIKRNKPYSLISLHNHPTNNPPTGSDLSANAKRKYALGVVVTHNGKVYSYKAGNKPFLPESFDKRVDKYRGNGYNMNEEDAIIQALKDYSKEYDIKWREH